MNRRELLLAAADKLHNAEHWLRLAAKKDDWYATVQSLRYIAGDLKEAWGLLHQMPGMKSRTIGG